MLPLLETFFAASVIQPKILKKKIIRQKEKGLKVKARK